MSTTAPRHVVPVMISVGEDFSGEVFVVSSPKLLSQRSALALALSAFSTTTKIMALTLMAAVLIAIPALSGILAYHFATKTAAVNTTQITQQQAEQGTFIVPSPPSK